MLTGHLDIFLNIRNVFSSDLMLSLSSSVTWDLWVCVDLLVIPGAVSQLVCMSGGLHCWLLEILNLLFWRVSK